MPWYFRDNIKTSKPNYYAAAGSIIQSLCEWPCKEALVLASTQPTRVVLDTAGLHFRLPVLLTFPFHKIVPNTGSGFAGVCENTQRDSTYYRHSLGVRVALSGRQATEMGDPFAF